MIDKRTLRFARMTPLLGVCQYCSVQFSGSEEEIRREFSSHQCRRPDFAEAGLRMIKKAGKDE